MGQLRLSTFYFLLFATWTLAEEALPGPEALSIEQLTQQVLAYNPELRFYEAEIENAKGQRRQAGLWHNPEFSGEYGERRINDAGGNLLNKGLTRSATITQTFEFPGKASLRKAIANKDIVLAELGLEQFRLSLKGKVKLLAYRYLAATSNARVALEISDRSSTLIELIRQRPSAGIAGLLDQRIIEGSLLELQRSATQFEQERAAAQIELNVLRGKPTSHPLKIEAKQDLTLKVANLDELIFNALNNNYLLKIRQIEIEKAIQSVSAAKMDIAPDFVVGPFFSQDRAGDNEVNLGGSVAVTLPLWNWNQGNIDSAKARQDQALAMSLQAKRQIDTEVSQRFSAYQLLQRQFIQTSNDTIKNLQDASDLADRQYRLGAISVQTFLEMQRQFLATQQSQNSAWVEAQSNLLDLELLTGGKVSKGSEGRK